MRVDRGAPFNRDRYPSAAAGCIRHCCAGGDPMARRGLRPASDCVSPHCGDLGGV